MFDDRLSLNCRLSLCESAPCDRTFAEQKTTLVDEQGPSLVGLNN